MPVAIVTKAHAKHPPVAFVLRRVIDDVGRPRDTQTGVRRLTDEKEVWAALRFPGKMALRKADGPSGGALVLALVHASLRTGDIRLRDARPGREESQKNQQGNGQPSYPHIRLRLDTALRVQVLRPSWNA